MERLTERIEGNYIARQDRVNGKIIGNQQCLNKLGQLEDAEEKGLLLRLPCKVGDTLYAIRELFDGKETKVIEEIVVRRFDLRALQRFVITSNGHRLNFSNFGKTVFLTKEEAEQALAEMKGV